VSFQGQVVFAAAIPGIDAQDLLVGTKSTTEATGPGEQCEILSMTSDSPDAGGDYPDAGTVTAEILLSRGGPQVPDGECIVTVQAAGTDGVSVSARGSETLFITANQIDTDATITVPTITVRQSKAVAGIDSDCLKWVKRRLRRRARCNSLLLRLGPPGEARCRDAGPEPPGCDPGQHVEAILALAHGMNDQQTNPMAAEAVDLDVLSEQVKCQRRFGFAAANFVARRTKLVDRLCLDANADSEDCRGDRSRDAKPKLDVIDKCEVDQLVDVGTGRAVPDVGAPCETCIAGGGNIDRKCLKDCFQLVLDELSDGILGDIPECGNGIVQPPEVCDDGNLLNGDCCSDQCTAENLGNQSCGTGVCQVTVPVCQDGEPVTCTPGSPGTEGPMGDPTCGDGLDNDCDGATDGADGGCL
jgi:cysteine-rich repeat protein